MGCGCGRKSSQKTSVNRRGTSLNKYGFLKPNQLAILKEQEKNQNQGKDK
jgi:hypothetical protein